MKNRFPLLILLSALVLTIPACRGGKSIKNIHEGEIYYNIKYIRNPSSFSSEFLPKELVVSFRNDLFTTRLRAPFGNSGLTTVINPKEGIYDTYLNILSFKYFYEGTQRDMQPGFSSMKDIQISETGRKSVICGLNCRQARVTLKDSSASKYIWYTNDIRVDEPNRGTPYKDIDGVLMDFFYIMGKAEIEFTADEVFSRQVPDKYFAKKTDYKKVSKSYLDALILKMISF